jgi:hypothetical protein
MHEEQSGKPKTSHDSRKRNIIMVAVIAVIVIAVILVVQLLNTPQRSVASYCKAYAEEKTRLKSYPGNTYPSGVFNEELSDASQFATSFGRLEKVAPDEIKSDVSTLKSVYQKIHDDPSQALSASLSAAPADDSLKAWTLKHCGDR